MANAPVPVPDHVPTLIGYAPAPVPAPVAAQPRPANPAPAQPVAIPVVGTNPNPVTPEPAKLGRIQRFRNWLANPNPNPKPAKPGEEEWAMRLSPLGRVAKAVGMLSYGENGLTPRAAASLGAIALAIVACTTFEVMLNWRGSGLLFAHEAWYVKWLFRLVFISVLGTLIYVMDMSWGARDMGGNPLRVSLVKPDFFSKENFWHIVHLLFGYTARGFYTRLVVLLILTIFNSMSGHVSFFEKEIEDDILAREARNVTAIREVAMNAIAPTHWDAIDDARDAIPRDPQDTTLTRRLNRNNTQPACYTVRCRQRRELVRSNTEEEQRRTGRIRVIQNGNDRENETGRGGRPPGRGVQWTRGQVAEQAQEAEFNRIRAANRAELRAFDAESERVLQAAVSNWEAANERIRTMNKDKLASDYGRTWHISRGPLEQLTTLYKLLWRDKLMGLIALAIMLLIQVPTLMVMGAGYLMFTAARDYLSEIFQAANGNLAVRRALLLKGIADPESLLIAPELRELRGQFFARAAALSVEASNLRARAGYHARKRADGTYPKHREVQQALHSEWAGHVNGLVHLVKPEPIEADAGKQPEMHHETGKADDMAVINLAVIDNGGKPFEWPAILNNGVDPRIQGQEPWRVSKEFLTEQFGWEDPEKDRPEQERLIALITQIRREIVEIVLALDAATVQMMDDPLEGVTIETFDRLLQAPLMVVRLVRAAWWNRNGEPAYRRLAVTTSELLDIGGVVPHWRLVIEGTALAVDPRDYNAVRRYALFVTDAELRRVQGGSVGLNPDWTPDVPRPPTASTQPAPASAPAPPESSTEGSTEGTAKSKGHTDGEVQSISPDDLEEVAGDDITTNKVVTKPPPVPGAAPNAN